MALPAPSLPICTIYDVPLTGVICLGSIKYEGSFASGWVLKSSWGELYALAVSLGVHERTNKSVTWHSFSGSLLWLSDEAFRCSSCMNCITIFDPQKNAEFSHRTAHEIESERMLTRLNCFKRNRESKWGCSSLRWVSLVGTVRMEKHIWHESVGLYLWPSMFVDAML